MNEIFYEFQEIKRDSDLNSTIEFEIVLHFLSKVEEYLILYETKLNLSKISTSISNSDQEVIEALDKIFNKVDPSLSLIKGKIREIFISRA